MDIASKLQFEEGDVVEVLMWVVPIGVLLAGAAIGNTTLIQFGGLLLIIRSFLYYNSM